MKHFRSLTALLLTLMLLLVPFAGVLAEGEPEAAEWEQLPLGSSGYAIKAPAGYTDQGVTDDEYVLGYVSTYTNPDTGIDIEVSQYAATEEGFQAFAEAQYNTYGGKNYSYEEDFNGMCVAGFENDWTLDDGSAFCSATVLLDAGESYICIDFGWAPDNEGARDAIIAMIATLGKAETIHVRLGSSPYFVTLPKGYYQGEVTSEEAATGIVAYYLNDNLLFDFDIYENYAGEDATLADVAMQLCAANGGSDLQQQEINGIPVYTYTGTSVYDGVEYETVTAVLESSNGTFIAVVCWIDDEPMRIAAMGMLGTIATEDELIPDEPMTLRIGASGYCITLPTTFVAGAVSEDEFEEEGYIGCYYSPYALFDIDVYQCPVEKEEPTLAAFTEKDAAKYNGTEISLDDEINGVPMTSYRSNETYNDISYRCLTYTFEEKGVYYQICFYWTDDDAEEDVEAAMETLAPVEMATMAIGSSPYVVTVPAGMEATEIEYEDDPDLKATLYKKEPLKFIVYETVIEGESWTLEEFATAEANYYNGTGLTFSEINGIPVASYYYTRTDDQYNKYAVLTYCIKSGENGYIDIDFYVDDYVGAYQGIAIINTLTLAQ